MARAKTLSDAELGRTLEKVAHTSSNPLRDYVMVLLSFRQGLRAAEIAGLKWGDVLTAEGHIADDVVVPNGIAKKGVGGSVPMHAATRAALCALYNQSPPDWRRPDVPIVRGKNWKPMSPNNLQKYMSTLYGRVGLQGVTSHSGRRTWITKLAQTAALHGCSIRDVQRLARHADMGTTEKYIEASTGVRSLVNAL